MCEVSSITNHISQVMNGGFFFAFIVKLSFNESEKNDSTSSLVVCIAILKFGYPFVPLKIFYSIC